MTDETVDFAFIARKLEQVIAEQRRLTDDMRVLTAMVMRQDGTLGLLAPILDELRAIHRKLNGYDQRLHKLEAQ